MQLWHSRGRGTAPARLLFRYFGRALRRRRAFVALGEPLAERYDDRHADAAGEELEAQAGDHRLGLHELDADARQPALERRVGHQHLAGDPADQRTANRYDDREAFHKLQQQRGAEDDQRDRDGETEDQQEDAATRRGRHGDDVVQAHDQVGDEDSLDGGEELVARRDLRVVVLGHQQLHADPEQQQAADDLEPGKGEQRHREQREEDPHHDGGPRTPDDRLRLLLPGQRARGERDHHRVVARQDDIDADDLSQSDPEFGGSQIFEHHLF